MAAKEPYDYLSSATADVDYTLAVSARGRVTEESTTNVVIHVGDDGSEERILLSSTPTFYLSWDYGVLSESDSGTVMDVYHTTAKGRLFSFKYAHDGHTYVVRFDCDLERSGPTHDAYGTSMRLKILGYA